MNQMLTVQTTVNNDLLTTGEMGVNISAKREGSGIILNVNALLSIQKSDAMMAT